MIAVDVIVDRMRIDRGMMLLACVISCHHAKPPVTTHTNTPTQSSATTWRDFAWQRGGVELDVPATWEVDELEHAVVIAARPPAAEAMVVLVTGGDRAQAMRALLELDHVTVATTEHLQTEVDIDRGTATIAARTTPWSFAWRRAKLGDVVVLAASPAALDAVAAHVIASVKPVAAATLGDGTIPQVWRDRLDGARP
jgi:hypothetical protein